MNINIFILCYNESILLPHTIKHYKTLLPSCKIHILDNYSTDNSVAIAENLGCNIIKWKVGDFINDYEYRSLKNTIWKKYCTEGWIIVCDMDEWLMINEETLLKEQTNGTTILKTKGYEMLGESQTIDLSDIDLFKLNTGIHNKNLSKTICFNMTHITDINFDFGAHNSKPFGNVTFSTQEYIIKHMNMLGEQWYINKLTQRFIRAGKMQKRGLAAHYTNNVERIKNEFVNKKFINCNNTLIETIPFRY